MELQVPYRVLHQNFVDRLCVYGKIKTSIGKILRTLCEQKKVEILEANACADHIHMPVSIPPKLSVSQFMGYLKWEKLPADI